MAFLKSYLSDGDAILGFQSTYITLFQWIVGGHLGDGADVLRPVDMDHTKMDVGG